MTQGQAGTACPQCGSAAAVHSIQELAAMARGQLGEQFPGQAAPQPGYAAQPQPGPVPGWAGQPQSGPVPGWAGQPQAGPPPGPRGSRGRPVSRPSVSSGSPTDMLSSLGEDLAGAALGAAAGFLGRALSRRVQRAVTEQVLPAAAARGEAIMREQIAIAEKYPDLCACLTDKVAFLAGGSSVVSLAGHTGMITMELADAVVAQLRGG